MDAMIELEPPDASPASDNKWTIKNIAPNVRHAAIQAAQRANMQIGPWVSKAITAQVLADRTEPRDLVPVTAPTVEAPPPPPPPAPTIDAVLSAAERLVALTKGDLPPTIQRAITKAVREAARNLTGPTRKG